MAWLFRTPSRCSRKSGFSSSSTAEDVTQGIDASRLTAIVTGASSGIGAETARVLAKRGAQVVMAVRTLSSGETVKQNILQETSDARVSVLQLDLSSMASIRRFATEFQALNVPLNILINNAGIMASPFELSADGIELQFATNCVGPFLLTNLLLDNMKQTAKDSGVEGRIVMVSSEAHRFTYKGGIRFDRLNVKSGYNSWYAYGQSKLADILLANELSRRFKEEGVNIVANSLHPGAIQTNLQKHWSLSLSIVHTLTRFIWKSIPQGAATQCLLALHPFANGISGKYFKDCNESSPSGYATNPDLAKTLWEFNQKLV